MLFASFRSLFAIRSILLLGLFPICGSVSSAQSWPVSYMTIPPVVPILPGTTTMSSFKANLPGYSNGTATDVLVTFKATPAYGHQTESFLAPGGVAGPYTWGTVGNDINVFAANSTLYTVTFSFLNGLPDPRYLLLTVIGLDYLTTATVSQPGNLVGEYQFSSTPPSAKTCLGLAASTSLPCPTAGSVLYSNYTASGGVGDIRNTGWALFQATSDIDIPKSGAPVNNVPTLTVTFNQDGGDGIGFTLGYASVPDSCCPPFDKDIMLEQLTLTQTGNVLGTLAYGFLNSKPYKTQMQAYLDYLHSLNPAIANISLDWSVYDLGPGGPGSSPNPTGPLVAGSPVLTTWGCTGCSPGGGGTLIFPTGPEPPAGYPIASQLQPNEWYGFSVAIALNGNIQFWPATCGPIAATFDVYADPFALPVPRLPGRIPVEVRAPGAASGHIVMLPSAGPPIAEPLN